MAVLLAGSLMSSNPRDTREASTQQPTLIGESTPGTVLCSQHDAEVRAAALERMSDEVYAQKNNPTQVHEDETALDEPGLRGILLPRKGCREG
jgi:hypothetical protein